MERGSTTGSRELDIDLQRLLVDGRLPDVDITALQGDDLLRQVIFEQRRTNALLEAIVVTTRFNRGNYDGPYIGRKKMRLPLGVPVRVLAKRRFPTALRIETTADASGDPKLLLSADKGSIRGGDVYSLTTAREVRIIVAADQELWAAAVGTATTPFEIILKEARL